MENPSDPTPARPKLPRLFRDAAVLAHTRRLEGEVLIIQPPSVPLLLGLLGTFALVALVFVSTATYARSERVTGYLAPRGGVSTILPTRTGTVTEVLVRTGDLVSAGDVLLRVASQASLEDGSGLEEGLEQALQLQQRELATKQTLLDARLAAEQRRREQDLGKLAQQRAELGVLESVASQRLALARQRQDALSVLLEKGIISDKQYRDQVDVVLGLEAGLRQARYSVLEQDDVRRALESELEMAPAEVAAQKADLQIRILEGEARIRELEGRKAYAVVAPVAGRVASLQAVPGAKLVPNVPVALVIPATGELEAQLLVPTRAAGLIAVGQRVGIQYAAFPHERFGTRAGRIHQIDTAVLGPEEVQGPIAVQEPVYRVRATLDDQAIQALGRSYALQPGMRLEADITLETRSFLAWILEPLYALRPAAAVASAS